MVAAGLDASPEPNVKPTEAAPLPPAAVSVLTASVVAKLFLGEGAAAGLAAAAVTLRGGYFEAISFRCFS